MYSVFTAAESPAAQKSGHFTRIKLKVKPLETIKASTDGRAQHAAVEFIYR
jgi:hypothetical protein